MEHQHDSSCKKEIPTTNRTATLIFSIPWCCVVSLGIAILTTTGSLLGLFFDEILHKVIPFLAVFHIFGIIQYAKHPHKTRNRTRFLVATTLLFIASIGFHFTEIHDHLLTAP